MQTIRILLIDTRETVKRLLEHELINADSMKFEVTLLTARAVRKSIDHVALDIDAILFGEKTPRAVVVDLTTSFRAREIKIPILLLSRQSEARLHRELRRVGVDDILNIAEMNTPLFSWTFQSLIDQIETRKKAKEYEVLRHRMQSVDGSMGTIIHDLNSPLSVLRLATHQLLNNELADEKRSAYLKLLADNIDRLDIHMDELRDLRKSIGQDSSVLAKILSIKEVKEVIASH